MKVVKLDDLRRLFAFLAAQELEVAQAMMKDVTEDHYREQAKKVIVEELQNKAKLLLRLPSYAENMAFDFDTETEEIA